jgi:hypothetical protein
MRPIQSDFSGYRAFEVDLCPAVAGLPMLIALADGTGGAFQ